MNEQDQLQKTEHLEHEYDHWEILSKSHNYQSIDKPSQHVENAIEVSQPVFLILYLCKAPKSLLEPFRIEILSVFEENVEAYRDCQYWNG